MKKARILLGTLACVLACVIPFGMKEIVAEADSSDFTVADGVLTAYSGTDVNVIIPEGVTEIGSSVFQKNTTMETVEIPDTVTTIGANAFYGCTSLKELVLPDSVTKIGDSAFTGCESLTSLTLSKSLSNSGYYCFSGCTGLTEVEIPKSLSSANYMFRNCSNLKTVTFEEGAAWIATGLFNGCDGLEEIVIPETVEKIQSMCFESCVNLSKVTLSSNVTTIGGRAFYGTGITELELPVGVESIGTKAFGNCTVLEKITIPYTVTSINADAFSDTENVVIYCNKNSYAEEFAAKYGIACVAKEVPAESVTLNASEVILEKDETFLLQATITPDGYMEDVVWSSSDIRVATVSEYGRILPRRIGVADITVTVGECSATCKVTVVRSKATPAPTETPVPTEAPSPSPTATPAPTASPKPTTPEGLVRAFVERMYTVALGREAETEGAEYWTNSLLAGDTTGAAVADGFISGAEFIGRCLTDRDYVETLYATFFDREAAEADIEFWVGYLKDNSRRQALAGFANSQEFAELCQSYGILPGSISGEEASGGEVMLNATELSIRVGEVKKLSLLNYDGEVSWSSRTGGVSIDEEGNVTGLMPVTDYVDAVYQGQRLLCTITVLNTTAADWVYSEDGNNRTRTNYLGEVVTEVRTVIDGEEVWGYFNEEYTEEWRAYIQEIRRNTQAGVSDGYGNAIGIVNSPELVMTDAMNELAKRSIQENVCGVGSGSFTCLLWGAQTPLEAYESLYLYNRNLLGAITNPDFVYGGVSNFWWDRMGTGVDLYPYWCVELDLYHADADGKDDLQYSHNWEIMNYTEDGHANFYCRDGFADEGYIMYCGLAMFWNPETELYEFQFLGVDGKEYRD